MTRIAMALYQQNEGWTIERIDIEAVLLNAELESNRAVFTEWPEGIVELGCIIEEERMEYCIKLTTAMYGVVDVLRLSMKTLCKYSTQKMRVTQSHVKYTGNRGTACRYIIKYRSRKLKSCNGACEKNVYWDASS